MLRYKLSGQVGLFLVFSLSGGSVGTELNVQN